MLQKLMEDDDFLQVSSARRLLNISGTVRAIDMKFSQRKDMGLHVKIEGSTAAPLLPWWQKLELTEYLRNRASK
jgi:hypothetical protein